jgi:hypothetical protein
MVARLHPASFLSLEFSGGGFFASLEMLNWV